MSVTYWLLAILLGVAGVLCIWGAITGRPAPDPKPASRHGRWVGEGDTRPLTPPEPPASRGRCSCLHLAHIGRCRAAECPCVTPEVVTEPRRL